MLVNLKMERETVKENGKLKSVVKGSVKIGRGHCWSFPHQFANVAAVKFRADPGYGKHFPFPVKFNLFNDF